LIRVREGRRRAEEYELKGAIESEAFRRFQQAAAAIANPSVRHCREQGGKVMGYICSAVPEEIFTAAGFLPLRLRATGSTGTELSDSCFSSVNCSFVRHCFNMALLGEYDFLDGLVLLNSCDNVRRIYDHWIRELKTPFVRIMSFPRKTGQPQVDWYEQELAGLRKGIEEHFGVEVSDDRLWEAIGLHNETRRLQRQLYALRKGDRPAISGADTLAVIVAGTAMPKETYNRLLRELLDELSGAEGIADYRARLMILGSILDDPAYVGIIEEQGGLVVTDSTCYGSRIMWKDVNQETDDAIGALAQYYIADRQSCPRTFGDHERRAAFVRDMIRDFRVDGVIGERMAFCDQWGFAQYSIENDFKDEGIPHLFLEREYILSGVGQLKTRVQAFLETLVE
jgi:benzoyl-CoA reductase/2-hydroxyglutaryl-CoA dehydratase subunit BcrC/BadD/HgdB